MGDAPSWFYPVALSLFPASFVLLWALSHVPNSALSRVIFQLDKDDASPPYWLPIAAGIGTGVMLVYGANTYSDDSDKRDSTIDPGTEAVACLDLRDKLRTLNTFDSSYEVVKRRLSNNCPAVFVEEFGYDEYYKYHP